MSGGKGGSTTSQVEIPAWLENAAIENINRARDVQKIGYTPYYGPDVAAFTPMQQQAMQATGGAASAFGLAPQGFDATAGIPQAQEFAGGLMGYSSQPLYQQSVNAFRQARPAQAMALEGMFIDPYTGQYTAPDYSPTAEQISQTSYVERANRDATNAALKQAEINKMLTADQVASAVDDQLAYRFGDLSTGIADAQRSINDLYIPEGATAEEIAAATDAVMNYRFGDMTNYLGGISDQIGGIKQGPTAAEIAAATDAALNLDYRFGDVTDAIGGIDYRLDALPSETNTTINLGTAIAEGTGGIPAYVYDLEGNLVSGPTFNYDPVPEGMTSGYSFDMPPTYATATTYDYGTPEAAKLAAHYGELGAAMEEAAANNYVAPTGSISTEEALAAAYQPLPEIVGGEGLVPPTDMGIMDVLGTATAVTPLSLGSALLTGSIINPNTDPVSVVDQGTKSSNLPKGGAETDVVTALASQGPTGTYNQAYWAEKLASGATQAELKAEQDEIAAAGGKVYTGSTPQETTTTSASGSGK